MFSHKFSIAFSLALIASAMVPASAATKAEAADAKADKAEKVERADIGTITELARQITVERQRKELRELRNAGKATANVPGLSALGAGYVDPLSASPSTKSPSSRQTNGPQANAQSSAPSAPVVSYLVGSSAGLIATLDSGRRVQRGDVLAMPNATWTVESVTASGVTWRRCDSAAPTKGPTSVGGAKTPASSPASPVCVVQNTPVGSRS